MFTVNIIFTLVLHMQITIRTASICHLYFFFTSSTQQSNHLQPLQNNYEPHHFGRDLCHAPVFFPIPSTWRGLIQPLGWEISTVKPPSFYQSHPKTSLEGEVFHRKGCHGCRRQFAAKVQMSWLPLKGSELYNWVSGTGV